MDTGYVQLVFDIFFDSTSDGNMTDNSDIHTAEFAVYLFLLSVSKSVPTTGRARPRAPCARPMCAPAPRRAPRPQLTAGCAGMKHTAARPARCEPTSRSRRSSRRLCRPAAASSCPRERASWAGARLASRSAVSQPSCIATSRSCSASSRAPRRRHASRLRSLRRSALCSCRPSTQVRVLPCALPRGCSVRACAHARVHACTHACARTRRGGVPGGLGHAQSIAIATHRPCTLSQKTTAGGSAKCSRGGVAGEARP